ncbi:Checkpoint protein HUS1 [Trachymyrmex zeteki]|uniref:Checkpoint protein HUS1 n=1 Tax=Mycetomoellerius zeteki TaxID=64791 RepID=A0A151WP66_9HYME|nr:Checkpoint protein HUS1 [Trachymyrmex zeteki]
MRRDANTWDKPEVGCSAACEGYQRAETLPLFESTTLPGSTRKHREPANERPRIPDGREAINASLTPRALTCSFPAKNIAFQNKGDGAGVRPQYVKSVVPAPSNSPGDIVSTISRMAKYCVLQLAPTELCFNVGDEHIPVLWAVISPQYFFAEYIMSGVTEQENKIYLEFDASMFARSLNSLRAMAKNVKIKLTNKRQPCLTFEIDLTSLSLDSRQCVHDVPVKLIPRRDWPEHKMPDIPEFDVASFQISLEMPQLKYLRHITDKMKNMSSNLIMIANKHGTLIIKIDVNYATVSTHFKGLQVYENEEEQETDDIFATINIKKLSMFLGWDALHPNSVKCNLLKEKMVKLTLDVGDHIKIHYFIPAIAS